MVSERPPASDTTAAASDSGVALWFEPDAERPAVAGRLCRTAEASADAIEPAVRGRTAGPAHEAHSAKSDETEPAFTLSARVSEFPEAATA